MNIRMWTMILMSTILAFLSVPTVSGDCESGLSTLALSHARLDGRAGGIVFDAGVPGDNPGAIIRGVVESHEVPVAQGFDQAIVSWNAFTPPGSYLVLYLRARIGGSWTGWYNMGMWNTDGQPDQRSSFKEKDSFGAVDTDTLILKKRADAYKVRVELSSVDGSVHPVLRFICVNTIDSTKAAADVAANKDIWGTELEVPELCQLSVTGGEGWCSPTSTAMVLGYWSRKLKRPELAVGIIEVARNVFDKAWGGTGNWVFNTAYAGEFRGMRAYVTRFDGVAQIEEWLSKGVPVIVSVDYNRLNRRDRDDRMGHLMVIRGFTPEGDPIFNDPWAHLDKGQNVRKVFKRADLEYAWLGAGGTYGTVYLIYPEDKDHKSIK